ncbi:hypothetical protein [Pseudonocardia sp. GCM10023141]|uniref:hypothetical protein n=1 Tax=Pseudonocardia sp. GCM10023141 TaxID=3252653 RepID=UPI00360DADA2
MNEEELIAAEPSATTAAPVGGRAPAPHGRRRPVVPFAMIGAGVALLIVGINMRPAIVALSPLLAEIQAATGISSSTAGALHALPVLCFGIFAPLAPRLIHRFGMEALLAVLRRST